MAGFGSALGQAIAGGVTSFDENKRARERELLIAEQRQRQQELVDKSREAENRKRDQDAIYDAADREREANERKVRKEKEDADLLARPGIIQTRKKLARGLKEFSDPTVFDDITLGDYVSNDDNWKPIAARIGKPAEAPPAYRPANRDEYLANLREEAKIRADNRAPREPKAPSEPKPVVPTEGERKAGSQLGAAEAAAANIEAAGARPGFVERQISKLPVIGNAASRGRLQTLDQATRELSTAYLRVTSGATITADEIDLTMKTVMPQAGDRPETLSQKSQARRRMVEAVRGSAGRAATPAKSQAGRPDVKKIRDKYGLE